VATLATNTVLESVIISRASHACASYNHAEITKFNTLSLCKSWLLLAYLLHANACH